MGFINRIVVLPILAITDFYHTISGYLLITVVLEYGKVKGCCFRLAEGLT